MSAVLLKQVRLLNPEAMQERRADVLVSPGQGMTIVEETTDRPTSCQERDGSDLVLGPGLVDLYSHSGEPGYEARETLMSLCQSAIAGGFKCLTLLPTTKPAMDHPAIIHQLRQRWQALPDRDWELTKSGSQPVLTRQSLPQIQFWGALTLEATGTQMAELANLAPEVIGFSDGHALDDHALLLQLLDYARPLGKPLMFMAWNPKLAGSGVMREGIDSLRFGLPGSPVSAETAALAEILEILADRPTPVHVMRLSSARSMDLIRQAKADGLPITASTTWMYLIHTSQDIGNYDPNLRLVPPLGSETDRCALIQAIQDGTLDGIAIDHTPYTYEEKTVAFAEAPPGAIGLELALPLLWQHLVDTQQLTALQLWRALTIGAYSCLAQTFPDWTRDLSTTAILFDPTQTWTVTRDVLRSRSVNTPWLKQQIRGRVIHNWPLQPKL